MSEAALALTSSGLVAERYRPLRPSGAAGRAPSGSRATNETGLDVALKIVPREGKAATRAEREALAAARLRHERCLRAYAFERDTRNVYIAYEYVPGQTMRQALRAGALDDAAAVEAAAQVLEALAHAHERGVVHRDVKPSNVLVAEADEMSIRLLDFGLAQLAEEEPLTATGDVPGTLAYVPPERLRGEPGEPAADIWAVGVMLWEALSGWHPFWNGSLLDTARKIEGGAAPLATVRPDLPKPLCALVDRMLSLDPAAGRPPRSSPTSCATPWRSASGGRPREAASRSRRRCASPARPPRASSRAGQPLRCLSTRVPRGRSSARSPSRSPSSGPGSGLPSRSRCRSSRSETPRRGSQSPTACWPASGSRSPGARRTTASSSFSDRSSRRCRRSGLLPLAAQGIRSAWRRALQVAAAVLLAAIVAGLRHASLPFTAAAPPKGLGITGSQDPLAVAVALWRAAADRPVLLLEALLLAAAAVAIPYAVKRGPWGLAVLGGGVIALTLLPAPAVAAAPIVVAVWATCTVLAFKARS